MRYPALILALALALCAACGSSKTPQQQATDLLNQGLKAHAAGNLDQATKDYEAVLVKDPRNMYAYYNLGVIDQSQGRIASAENNYRLALSINPNFESALYNLGIVRTAEGDPQGAIALYRQAIQVQPNNASAHLNLGLLLRQQGNAAEGNQEVATATQLDPHLPVPSASAPTPAAP